MSAKRADALTPSRINLIAFAVRNGEAGADDARSLLALFCNCVDSNRPVPRRLLQHFADAFRAFLEGYRFTGRSPRLADFVGSPAKPAHDPANWMPVSIASALGLEKRRGRPRANEQVRIRMAAAVLRHRLSGENHQDALANAARETKRKQTIIGEAWRDYKTLARAFVYLERDPSNPWTPDEEKRLRRIYSGKFAD